MCTLMFDVCNVHHLQLQEQLHLETRAVTFNLYLHVILLHSLEQTEANRKEDKLVQPFIQLLHNVKIYTNRSISALIQG